MSNDTMIRLSEAYEVVKSRIGVRLETFRRYYLGPNEDKLTAVKGTKNSYYYVRPSELRRYIKMLDGRV